MTDGRIAGLEEVMAAGWWPVEHAWLGRWLLRAAGGFTGRANSVLPLGAPGVPLDEARAVVEAFYRERGLTPRFCVPHPLPPGDPGPWPPPATVPPGPYQGPAGDELAGWLDARGYRLDNPTRVMTATVDDVLAATSGHEQPVTWRDEPDEGWLGAYRYRGRALPAAALPLLTGGAEPAFASVERDGTTAAVGRLTVAHGWAGITAMEVAPAYRRQGLARAVLRAAAERARARGVTALYLQVAEPNTAARALYAACGFADHHRYHYRVLDA